MLLINWNSIPKKYNYASMDADGQIWVYSDKPVWCSEKNEWEPGDSSDWDILCDAPTNKDEDFELAIDKRDYD